MSGGRTLEPVALELQARDARLWSELLDDANPLHSNPDASLAHGFGRGVVMPGPATAAHLLTLLLRNFPAAAIESFRARFVAAVQAPTKVEARGIVESDVATPSGRLVHCALELWAEGAVVVSATAQLRMVQATTADRPDTEPLK